MKTTTTTSKTNKRRTVPTKASCFTNALDDFQGNAAGGAEAVRAVVDVAGRLNVTAKDTLCSMARSLYDRAIKSKKGELKGFAVLARRLSDRLPR
jgi:hypothetical protein